MGRIGTTEILLIVLVIIILFGAKRIPDLMRSLGSGVREFKKGMRDNGEEKSAESKPGGEKPPAEKSQ
jgi:sec-independent protein translocase protein TatA